MQLDKELTAILEYLERERGLDRQTVLAAIEGGLLSVYRKKMKMETENVDCPWCKGDGKIEIDGYNDKNGEYIQPTNTICSMCSGSGKISYNKPVDFWCAT